jgi:tetrahydromethanopterin S-methyltransferase subunit E
MAYVACGFIWAVVIGVVGGVLGDVHAGAATAAGMAVLANLIGFVLVVPRRELATVRAR